MRIRIPGSAFTRKDLNSIGTLIRQDDVARQRVALVDRQRFVIVRRRAGREQRQFDVGVGGSFGNQNDLAFIFDPSKPCRDPTLAAGMTALLDSPANSARRYLGDNLGQIAGRGAVRVVPGANQTLLRVTGFDAATSNYRYAVNPTFGQSARTGNRYRVQTGVRYRF